MKCARCRHAVLRYSRRAGHKVLKCSRHGEFYQECAWFKEEKAPWLCRRCAHSKAHIEKDGIYVVVRYFCKAGHCREGSCDKFEVRGWLMNAA